MPSRSRRAASSALMALLAERKLSSSTAIQTWKKTQFTRI
jgi:hypothetical protein